jgi:uncharacterized membrane protein YdjX (TVP38/TMEM64 family)
MPPVVENESQLHTSPDAPARTVKLDVHPHESQINNLCSGAGSGCVCHACVESSSLFGQAACVMVGARVHASEKNDRRRLGSQAFHWGVLCIAMLLSLPFVVPTLTEPVREWMNVNILHSPGSWKLWVLSVFSATLFSIGFVNRLGRERVHNSCAMLRRLGPAAILGVAWSAIPSFAGVMLILNMEPIRIALIGDGLSIIHITLGMSIYLLGFVILAGLGCLPTVSQAILAGYAFGLPFGLGLALIGFGGASLVGYEFVGRIARTSVENELQQRPRAAMLRDALIHASKGRALLIVTLLRASPGSPFALTNLLLGSLGVSRGVFLVGTVLGMLPRTLAAVLIGQQITQWSGHVDKPRWVIIAGIVSAILLVVVISKVAASVLIRVARKPSTSPIPAH